MSNSTGNTFLALLTGVAIGTGIGILFAPDKGSKTREKMKEGFDDISNEVKSRLDLAFVELQDKYSIAKIEVEDTYDELVSDISHKTEDVISFLEEKLSELKKQNAKLQKNRDIPV